MDVPGRPSKRLRALSLILPLLPGVRLARLPALVALNPPAEYPLIKLWLVIAVLLLVLVLVLCAADEAMVVVDFVEKVRLRRCLPNS